VKGHGLNVLYPQNRLRELADRILTKGSSMTGAEVLAHQTEGDECESVIKAHKQALSWAGGAPDNDGTPPAGAGGPGGWSASGVDSGKRLTFGRDLWEPEGATPSGYPTDSFM
jgi:hypothetical protein